MAKAQDEAREIIEQGRTEAVRLAEEFKENSLTEAQNLRRQGERDIAAAKNQALRDIYRQTTELATDIAGKIVGKTLNAKEHHQLLQESLSKIQQESQNDETTSPQTG